jgi:glyoxylate/hydroxypyruvate reductase A
MTFLYKADPIRGAVWAKRFAQHLPDLPFRIWPDMGDPRAVRYMAAWEPPHDLATRFPNLEILFSTGAGVDQFDFSAIPASLPVVRMVALHKAWSST